MKNKILWKKPNYNGEWARIDDKEIDDYCIKGGESGDVKIFRNQWGRTKEFLVYRIEKVGTLVEGIDTLSRKQAIDELKKLLKEKK